MNFHRASVIFIAVMLILVGVAASLSIAMYLSWTQAKESELDKLYSNNARAIQRSRICLNELYDTLDQLEKIKTKDCTSKHIQTMNDILFNKYCINEIAYLEDNKAQCGSEGILNQKPLVTSDSYLMPNGTSFILNSDIFAKHNDDFITLKSDHYAVSIDAERLSDIITEPYIKIAIVTNAGQVLSTLNYTDYNLELIHKLLKHPNVNKIKKHLLAISRVPGLYYISAESMSYVFKQWRKNLILFLPFGLIMSLIATGAVIWGLKKRLSPVSELKLAIAHREMVVYYQPILDYKTGRCSGAEALVRWQRPDGSMIKPDFFIPLAEESGLIQPITDQIIESVITNLKDTLVANRDLHIAINIAVIDFNSQRIFEKLESMLSGTDIKPHQIWLEITERGFMNFEKTRNSLQQIRKQGYTIVMDDFGTGYSSLSYLKELPIDVLKIDKAFVNSVDTDSVTSHVTGHIINIAKTLNLKIVAEGVETNAQSEYLKSHEVDFAQGWLYAKAMPLDEFISFCEFNV